jgi:hypothetical protein
MNVIIATITIIIKYFTGNLSQKINIKKLLTVRKLISLDLN